MPNDLPRELLEKPYRYYMKKHWRLAGLGLLSLFFTNVLETAVPWLVGETLDQITSASDLRSIGATIARIFVVIVFLSWFRYLWRVFWGRFHHTVAEDLRNRVFAQFTVLGPTYFRTRKIGELMSLVTNDVNSFRMGIGPGFLVLFDALMVGGMILPIMISVSWPWTWKCLILMPIVPFLIKRMLAHLHAAFHARQERFSEMSGSAQEIVSGIRVIKGFAQEPNQTRLFNVFSGRFRDSCDRIAYLDSMFSPTMQLPVALGCAALLVIGAPDVAAGTVSIGAFFAFYQYVQRMIWPMEGLGVALGNIQEGRAAFQRLRALLEQELDVPDTGTIEIDELEKLEVRHLTFRYPTSDQNVLEDVSFQLNKGECLGVIGPTGCGKSTLIELICRQYPVPPGTILINGISIEKIKLKSLRKLIGLVPQEAFLFSRKIAENMALGRDLWTLEDVKSAARNVRLDQEVESRPEAYDALVGERGVNLSGGQKQRLTLARALMREAPLVILDDSLSAVDANTEQVILESLRGELKKTTSIVVSHRLASVRWADQILVLNRGAVETAGRHEELLDRSPIYKQIFEMQMEPELT